MIEKNEEKQIPKLLNFAGKRLFRLMGGVLEQFVELEIYKCCCKNVVFYVLLIANI